MPGFEEINSAVKLTAQRSKEKGLTLVAFPLYASLSLARQAQIYQKQPVTRNFSFVFANIIVFRNSGKLFLLQT